jgi:hypothetical protein
VRIKGAKQLRLNSGTPLNLIRRIYGPGVRDWRVGAGNGNGSIATSNRHTGKPHTHAREIARRNKEGKTS